MREIEDAREALDRVERHVKRSRFMLTHPKEAMDILHDVLTRPRTAAPTNDALIAQEIAREIDGHIYMMEHVAYRRGELFEREQRRA